MTTRIAVAMIAGAALAASSGCNESNDDYCCTIAAACEGMEMRPCSDPSRPYCDNFGDHGAGRTCIAPPGEPCSASDPCEDPDFPICVDGLCAECGESADCPASAPVCGEDSHACGSCESEADCEGFADAAFCEAGACVECRGSEDCSALDEPICDPDTLSCRGCAADGECASEVCDQAGGACIAEDDVLYVAADGGGALCTRDDPCGAIQDAVLLAAGARTWIKVAPGTYQESVSIDGKTVQILGAGADVSPAALQQPVVSVSGEAVVRIDGLRLHDAGGAGDADDGIACDTAGGVPSLTMRGLVIEDNGDKGVDSSGCTLTITQSTLSGNAGGGVSASGGGLTITQSTLSGNAGGGVSIDGGEFVLLNNFIVRNGGATSSIGGADVDGSAGSRFEHNTVVDNSVQSGIAGGLQCVGSLVLRNNIISGNDAEDAAQVAGNCTHRYSLIGPEAEDGMGNVSAAPSFVDPGEGDFHLQAGSRGVDEGEASEVSTDADGDARPSGDGPDMGADEVAR